MCRVTERMKETTFDSKQHVPFLRKILYVFSDSYISNKLYLKHSKCRPVLVHAIADHAKFLNFVYNC